MEPAAEACRYRCGTYAVWTCESDEDYNKCKNKETAERNRRYAEKFFARQEKMRILNSLLDDEELDKLLKKYQKALDKKEKVK